MALDPISIAMELGGKLLDRFLPDPEKRAAAQLDLVKMQETGELAKMANETESLKAVLADVQSARQREVDISSAEHAPYLNKIITPLLALIVTIGGGYMLFVVKDADTKMAVVSTMTLVLGYYFGTSIGSTKASQIFRDMVRKP